jgi:hypothetical protein
MSSVNAVSSGLVQLPSNTTTTPTITSATTTAASATPSVTTDVDIFPVGTSINPTNFVYDGQTNLLINSSVNQTTNSVQLQYFDPVTGYYGGSALPITPGFGSWNFDLVGSNYLNGIFSSSSVLGESTYTYSNMQNVSTNYLGTYNLDVTDNNEQTTAGASTDCLFFSLTARPYLSYAGTMYNSPGVAGAPTINNINPNYTNTGSDSFLFTSSYFKPTMNEILVIDLVFSVSNTSATYYDSTSSTVPLVNVTVYNKVYTKDMLASIASGNTGIKPKVYTTGLLPLQYLQSGASFDPKQPGYFAYNNIPLIIADGFQKVYVTMPVVYVPPSATKTPQYLNRTAGYTISGDLPTVNTVSGVGVTDLGAGTVNYGHFVIGVAYSYNVSKYNPGTVFKAEILIRNIWRSPIAIYNSYAAFSVNDLASRQVVVLFAKNANGGTFLVTNTGTPISQIYSYGVTSLGNFMQIMRAIVTQYDASYSIVDYFLNPTVVAQANNMGNYNISTVTLQPLLEGAIFNPPTVSNCPNMWYLMIKNPNTLNISVDPSQQEVFNYYAGTHFGLPNGILCSTGLAKYYNSELLMLSTTNVSSGTVSLFGNSLYLGLNTINNQSFYILVILPEALFNGTPLSTTNNQLSIYSTPSSLFYIGVNSTTSSAFEPRTTSISNAVATTTLGLASTSTSTYQVSKLVLSVSNVQIV